MILGNQEHSFENTSEEMSEVVYEQIEVVLMTLKLLHCWSACERWRDWR